MKIHTFMMSYEFYLLIQLIMNGTIQPTVLPAPKSPPQEKSKSLAVPQARKNAISGLSKRSISGSSRKSRDSRGHASLVIPKI